MASSDWRSPSPDIPNPGSALNPNCEELMMKARASLKQAARSSSISSQSSKGGCVRRGRKRKAKAGNRGDVLAQAMPPIRRLSAEKSDFRDIVHKFTGIPASPLSPRLRFHAAKSQHDALLAAAISQAVRTLDIICSYVLQHGSSCQDSIILLLREMNKSKSLALVKHLEEVHGISELGTESQPAAAALASSIFDGVDLKVLPASQVQDTQELVGPFADMQRQSQQQAVPWLSSDSH